MPGLQIVTDVTVEPITLLEAKNYLRVDMDNDDSFISGLISAAREACEVFCGRSFAVISYVQTLDSFPYYTDTVISQNSYPPSYASLPQYSTTMWNYSQMIKLFYPPLIRVDRIEYIAADGTMQTLEPDTDFVVDNINEPARIFPIPGSTWPPVFYTPNSVKIFFTCGYDGSVQPACPKRAITAMYQLLSNWYENREAAMPGSYSDLPNHVKMLLWSCRVLDVSPTRG